MYLYLNVVDRMFGYFIYQNISVQFRRGSIWDDLVLNLYSMNGVNCLIKGILESFFLNFFMFVIEQIGLDIKFVSILMFNCMLVFLLQQLGQMDILENSN